MNNLKRFFLVFGCLLLATFSLSSRAQPISFSGNLDFIEEDTGGGVYSGVPLGTLFTGTIDPSTGSGEISDGTTVTSFSCCIAAGGLDVSNDGALDSETAELINLLVGEPLFSTGQLVDTIDIEGDTNTPGGGRIEVGLSFLFPADTFDDDSPENYPFDPNDLLLSVFFIVEEDSGGDNDVYAAVGLLLDTPPAKGTLNTDGSETSAVISGGIKRSDGNSFADTFTAGDAIQIIANIAPAPEELGENAEIFIVVNDGANWILVTPTGLVPFDGSVGGLVAFDEFVLEASNDIDILAPFGGEFTLTSAEVGSYVFFVAYTTGGGVVTYTDEPIALNVTP